MLNPAIAIFVLTDGKKLNENGKMKNDVRTIVIKIPIALNIGHRVSIRISYLYNLPRINL